MTEQRETPVEFALRRHAEGASSKAIGAELEARGVPSGVIAIALSTAGASSAPSVDESTPYQRALKLKRQGLGAEAIAAQLTREGLSPADAEFVVRSLPDGALGAEDAPSGSGTGLEWAAPVVGQLIDQVGSQAGLPLGTVFDVLRGLNGDE